MKGKEPAPRAMRMDQPEAQRDEEIVGDLVVALLSVNAWRLEKTFRLYDGLRREGLFDPDAVAILPLRDVGDRLERAGYRRGDFMVGLLAGRLLDVAKALTGDGKATLRHLVEARDVLGLDAFLRRVKGIGPTVVVNFAAMRGITAKPASRDDRCKARGGSSAPNDPVVTLPKRRP